jgi:hypothetical protein
MLVDKRIYLASQSPRRRELLKQIGVAFDVLPLRAVAGRMDVIEIPNPGEAAADFAQRMASEKAACGWRAVDVRRLLRFPVLGADTVVELDGAILGKPADRVEAEAMLTRLSGALHCVHTAVERRDPHQRHAAGDARRGDASRAWCRSCTSSARAPRPGRQHLHGPRGARAARHAVGVHRHRPRARRLPARGRHLGHAAATASRRPIEKILLRGPERCWCR